jgi:hypothetical protein
MPAHGAGVNAKRADEHLDLNDLKRATPGWRALKDLLS